MSDFNSLLPSEAKDRIRQEVKQIIEQTQHNLPLYKAYEEWLFPAVCKKYEHEAALIRVWAKKELQSQYEQLLKQESILPRNTKIKRI